MEATFGLCPALVSSGLGEKGAKMTSSNEKPAGGHGAGPDGSDIATAAFPARERTEGALRLVALANNLRYVWTSPEHLGDEAVSGRGTTNGELSAEDLESIT